jgi:hypothetical protein
LQTVTLAGFQPLLFRNFACAANVLPVIRCGQNQSKMANYKQSEPCSNQLKSVKVFSSAATASRQTITMPNYNLIRQRATYKV